MLKKINRYLIENHPNLWHIRLPYLLLTGALLHVFAFLYGYIFLDTTVLTNGNTYDYALDSYFLLFDFILLLIVFFVWALQFYKNSVLKHYYKAENSYAIKTFFLLIILFFWNISSYLTFSVGVDSKRLQILEEYNVADLVKEDKFLSPLLLKRSFDYNIQYNDFITKNNIKFKEVDSDKKAKINHCTEKDFQNRIFNSCETKIAAIDSTKFSSVSGKQIIFYTLKNINNERGCPVDVIDSFHKYSHFEWNEIKNHPNYSTELDQLLNEKKFGELATRLDKYKEHINRIYHFTNFDSWTNLSYIEKKNRINLYEIYSSNRDYTIYRPFKNTQVNADVDINSLEDFDNYHFYFHSGRLDNFLHDVYYQHKYYDEFLGIVILCIIMSYVLLHFQFINFINVAIAVPIGGVLFILGIFFTLFTYDSLREKAPVIYLAIVLAIGLFIFFRSNTMKERIKEVILVFIAVLIPLTILLIYAVIGLEIYKETISAGCNYTRSYSHFVDPPFYEWHFIALALLSMTFYLWKIKNWKSKKE